MRAFGRFLPFRSIAHWQLQTHLKDFEASDIGRNAERQFLGIWQKTVAEAE